MNCAVCHVRCEACLVDATTCKTGCLGTNRSSSLPGCACNTGYYDDGSVNCVKCDYNCGDCTGSGIGNCSSCTGLNR